jgi:chloramphenicol-sensitive protein RarD
MITLGLLQYLAPILQFALGVLYFHEDMPAGRWIGFALVWVALAIFTLDSVRHRRRWLPVSGEAGPVLDVVSAPASPPLEGRPGER